MTARIAVSWNEDRTAILAQEMSGDHAHGIDGDPVMVDFPRYEVTPDDEASLLGRDWTEWELAASGDGFLYPELDEGS